MVLAWNNYDCDVCKMVVSYFHHLFLIYLFIQLLICQYGLMNIYFILWVIIQQYNFPAQILSALALTPPSCWFLCPFNVPPSFLSTSLFFDERCFKFLLYISVPALDSTIFPRSLGSFYWIMVLRNRMLGAGVPTATGRVSPLLLNPLSQHS